MKFSHSVVISLATFGSSASAFSPSTNRAGGARLASPFLASTAAETDGEVRVEVSSTANGEVQVEVSSTAANSPFFPPVSETMNVIMPMTTKGEEVDRIEPGRYDNKLNSIAMPFLKRPSKLDGSHAGDYGFDPLGLTEQIDLFTMQEAELRHARLAMLAVVGWPISELLAPSWMLQENGMAPSVLNGFNPLSFVATLGFFAGFGVLEYYTALRRTEDTTIGRKHFADMSAVWKYGVAGDYNFDPLNLYSTLLGDSATARKGLRDVEISHGRSAMLGITAFALWEKLTGHPIVENSMFFHPNLLLPALVAGYVTFNQLYEVKNDDQYLLQVDMTDEGKARLESWKVQLNSAAMPIDGTLAIAKDLGQKAMSVVQPMVQDAMMNSNSEGSNNSDVDLVEQAKKRFNEYCESMETMEEAKENTPFFLD